MLLVVINSVTESTIFKHNNKLHSIINYSNSNTNHLLRNITPIYKIMITIIIDFI